MTESLLTAVFGEEGYPAQRKAVRKAINSIVDMAIIEDHEAIDEAMGKAMRAASKHYKQGS